MVSFLSCNWACHRHTGQLIYTCAGWIYYTSAASCPDLEVQGKRMVGNIPKSCSDYLGLDCKADNLFWRQHLASRLHFLGWSHQWTLPYCRRFLQKREWRRLICASWTLLRLCGQNKAMLTHTWFCILWMCNTILLCIAPYSNMYSIFMCYMNVKFHYDSSTLLLL